VRAFAAIRRVVLTVALIGIAASAVFAYALLRNGTSAFDVVVIVIALLPAAVLLAFWYLLGELGALPARIRELPATAQAHGEQLSALVRGRPPRTRELPRAVWQLSRLRDDLTVYAPILPLLSVPFLVSVVVSAPAIAAEAVVAVIVLIVLAVN
jgi:hypothetical protein